MPNKPPKQLTDAEALGVLGVVAGAGCLGCFVLLVKLAFLALIAWGIFELVTWAVSK